MKFDTKIGLMFCAIAAIITTFTGAETNAYLAGMIVILALGNEK